MKKQGTKQTIPPKDEEVKVSRLDQLLTDAALATARWIRQWYKPIAIVLLVIVAGFIVNAIASSYSESRVEGVNERIHTILEKPEPGEPIDEKAFESLLADVKGKPLEKIVLKAAVERLLAQTRPRPAEEGIPGGAGDGGTAPPPSVPDSQAVEAAREKALSLSAEAAQRFEDDADMQLWARGIQARVESERNKTWLPAPWKYSVRPPREGDVAPPEAVPPDAVPPDAVPPDAVPPPEAGSPDSVAPPGAAPGDAPPTPPESPPPGSPGEGPKPEPGVSPPEGPTGEAK